MRHGNKQSGSGGASRSRKVSRTPSMTMPEKIGSMKWKGRLDKKSSSMNDKHGSSMKRMSTVEARNNRRTTVDGGHHSNRRASATDERHLSGSIVNRVMSMNRKHMRGNSFMSGSMGDIAADSDQTDDDESIISIDEILDPTSFPEHIRRLGIEAYEAMMNAAKEGDMCIVEKSYVIIGTPLRDQSLFFCALQNLIDMERQVRVQFFLIKRTRLHTIF